MRAPQAGRNEDDAAIVRSTIDLGRNLDLEVVAEGVETPEQAETLYRLGYRYAQGYHFSRPLTPLQVSGHLERTRTTLPV